MRVPEKREGRECETNMQQKVAFTTAACRVLSAWLQEILAYLHNTKTHPNFTYSIDVMQV